MSPPPPPPPQKKEMINLNSTFLFRRPPVEFWIPNAQGANLGGGGGISRGSLLSDDTFYITTPPKVKFRIIIVLSIAGTSSELWFEQLWKFIPHQAWIDISKTNRQYITLTFVNETSNLPRLSSWNTCIVLHSACRHWHCNTKWFISWGTKRSPPPPNSELFVGPFTTFFLNFKPHMRATWFVFLHTKLYKKKINN